MSKKPSNVMLLAAVCCTCWLCGCGKPAPEWFERIEPTTDEERRAVAEHAACILSPPPSAVSGDPDWDDAIHAAHEEARRTYCRRTLWEWQGNGFPEGGGRFTGRWKYAEESK